MSIDKSLRTIAENVIDSHTSFGELLTAEEKQFLLDHGVVRSALPGDIICEQGKVDSRVFILVIGEVEVSEGGSGQKLVLANLRRGEIFGEISALFRFPRVSTVEVTRTAVMLELPGEILEKVISKRAELSDAILARYQKRISETALRTVSMFRHLPVDKLQVLAQTAVIRSYQAGLDIINEATPGDALYFIIFGTASVGRVVNGEKLNLALLKTGDYFGEWSLLTGAPRSATVTAISRVDVLQVDCYPFLQFIQENPETRDRIDLVAYNRHAELTGSTSELDAIVAGIENILDDDTIWPIPDI
ncbi:MAG: cyclic nucleotide-binding domain-containing protein [Gammaproteobacteria bacterium]|nr:cyclic nucleotide-binding domain-containing protein [Gammaproteobacteria bacterium]